ncbi:hypothetical protein CPB86DRAFT_718430 [Serendipita vermifera]|nr:hypothetical protein CPB86DRAFT_718430 [Serendipita vermifera]
MITLPMIPTPAPAPPMGPNSSQAQRPRFACSICPKTFSSRVRAETCLNNHMNIKPFACNGICGVIGCPKRYASKALLNRHCTSFGERTVLCPKWYVSMRFVIVDGMVELPSTVTTFVQSITLRGIEGSIISETCRRYVVVRLKCNLQSMTLASYNFVWSLSEYAVLCTNPVVPFSAQSNIILRRIAHSEERRQWVRSNVEFKMWRPT